MKLLVDRLTPTPTPFQYTEGEDWWRAHVVAGPGPVPTLVEPIEVSGRAYEMGEDLVLDGQIRGGLELECGRCLARYRHRLSEPFRLVLEPVGTRTPTEPEAAEALARDGVCLTDESEMGWYRGSHIQLDSVCLEAISLALPVKPLCREDCAGLCPRCGVDRNEASCGCNETAHESPFAVLAALRGDSTEGAH